MLQVEGLRRFQHSLQAQRARAEGKLTSAYRSYVRKVFLDLLEHTPQWSGNLVYNWNVLLTNEGSPAGRTWYRKDNTGTRFRYGPTQMGSPEAIQATMALAEPKISRIHWNSRVTFANTADYAAEVQDDPGSLRPVNLVYGADMMANYIISKYSRGEVVLGGGTR